MFDKHVGIRSSQTYRVIFKIFSDFRWNPQTIICLYLNPVTWEYLNFLEISASGTVLLPPWRHNLYASFVFVFFFFQDSSLCEEILLLLLLLFWLFQWFLDYHKNIGGKSIQIPLNERSKRNSSSGLKLWYP